MKFAEALTQVIDTQFAQEIDAAQFGFDEDYLRQSRDEIATGSTNIRLSAQIIGGLAQDRLFRVPDVEYGTFDNCREYGVTVTVKGFTFAVYEHRNSDTICVNGCKAEDVLPYGPYAADGDKYDVLAVFAYNQPGEALAALERLIESITPTTTRQDLAVLGDRLSYAESWKATAPTSATPSSAPRAGKPSACPAAHSTR